MVMVAKQKDLSGASEWLEFTVPWHDKYLEYAVWGTFDGTITLQARSSAEAEGWIDIATLTGPTDKPGLEFNAAKNRQWRIGFKSGEYTSGTATVDVTA
jgi:hypothetical protein